jgi:hypothetical protein
MLLSQSLSRNLYRIVPKQLVQKEKVVDQYLFQNIKKKKKKKKKKPSVFIENMNKRNIAKKFNEAPIGVWTDIVHEKVQLSNKSFSESEKEIDALINKHFDTFFTKAILKKVVGAKNIIIWPSDGSLFNPVVDRVEVFRVSSNKYILLVRVNHLIE